MLQFTLSKVGTKLFIHDFIGAPEVLLVQDVFSVQELRAQDSGLLVPFTVNVKNEMIR